MFLLMVFLVSFATACSKTYIVGESESVEKTNFYSVRGSRYKDLEIDSGIEDAVLDFSFLTASKLLENKNVMYSPISFYMALSLLAQITEGKTRDEIMNVLGVSALEEIQKGNLNLFRKLCFENKIGKLLLANSVWVKAKAPYKEETIDILSRRYFASTYSVDFTDKKTGPLIGKWVNESTGGRLGKNDFADIDPTTMLILLNAVYFYDEWLNEFKVPDNEVDTFFTPGKKQMAEFMSQKQNSLYFRGEKYISAYLPFKNNSKMIFVLPNLDVDLEEILRDPAVLQSAVTCHFGIEAEVTYKIPKFEFSSDFDLMNLIADLGIQEALSPNADFSPLSESFLYLSDAIQKTFVSIDEKGCEAAAYTALNIATSTEPPKKKFIFTLNRPFIFAVVCENYPIFLGVVTDPGL